MSVPKIIHYSWLSKEPLPENLHKNFEVWKDILYDYEFVCWDYEKLKELEYPKYAYQAYLNKKWAFAADYLRMYAVYEYGGIWMDLDIELFKSFDPFLNHSFFIGRENWIQSDDTRYLTAHLFGAKPKHPFLEKCVEYYHERDFVINKDESLSIFKRFDLTTSPYIMSEIAYQYGYDKSNIEEDGMEQLEGDMTVYPSYYFCHPRANPLSLAFCVHHCTATWAKE